MVSPPAVSPHAEIIAIGDELTSGQRLDTNSQWLSQQLGDLGIPVRYHTTVADDIDAGIEVVRAAVARSHIVVLSGGLGPTADDLTRHYLATVAGVELELHQPSLEHIERLFASRQRTMPERNRIQAMLPVGSQAIHNPEGSAPGIMMQVDRGANLSECRVYALPGVPAELKEMWTATVAPDLMTAVGEGSCIRHHEIKCFGEGESRIEELLPDLIQRGRDPTVGITAHQATITLRISATGDSEATCEAKIDATAEIIREKLGSLVFGEGPVELEDTVVAQLLERGETIAVGEDATGGLLTQWLQTAGGSSGGAIATGTKVPFLGGLVINHRQAPPSVRIDPTESLSPEEQTLRFAEHVRELFGSTYGLAVGPLSSLADAPSGRPSQLPIVPMALAGPNGTISTGHPFTGHRAIRLPKAAKQALDLFRLQLSNSNENPADG